MKYSGIGGQAVMEGIMMKNKDKYSVAVRKPDKEIEIKVEEDKGVIKNKTLKKIPIIRGVLNFLDSMVLGMKTLTYSADFFMEDEEKEKEEKKKGFFENIFKDKADSVVMGLTVCFSIVLAVGIFIMLPYFISLFFQRFIDSIMLVSVLEGLIRVTIFIIYIKLISMMNDIKRLFMYHGAEHKCINCIEHGMELTVENVRKSSKEHKRCGTSFLLIVMVISIVFFMFIQVESPIVRMVLRLALVPVIAGVSYEFLRLAGRSDNCVINIFSKPGLWLQNLTTREPDDDIIEVGIAAVEAVFDWREYLCENFGKEQGDL